MIRLYLYNDLHAGDVLFTRPLIRTLLASGGFDVAVGVHRNHVTLVEDLADEGAELVVSDYLDLGPSPIWSLRADCPPGRIPIDTWLGRYPDTREHQWRNVVEVFERQLAEHGIENPISIDRSRTPMIDFRPRPIVPAVPNRTIYVDGAPARSGHSSFRFDFEALLAARPDALFLCTAPPPFADPRLLDGSRFDLRDLSFLSEQCAVILGKGSGPFCCTYTEANRFKPRAVCGYHAPSSPTFWDYEGNPLRYLETMDDVLAFLDEVLGPAHGRQEAAAR